MGLPSSSAEGSVKLRPVATESRVCHGVPDLLVSCERCLPKPSVRPQPSPLSPARGNGVPRSSPSTTSRRCWRRSPRPAPRLRRALPRDARRLGRRGARAPARAAHARRSGGAADRRPADAGDAGHGLPRAGAQARPRGQARAADGLRRHRGGDRGDQRGGARLLPAQAVGPARGAAVPGRRGPAHDLGGGGGAGVRRRARGRPPLLASESHDLRDFLVRNRVPARWLDVERDGEARELLRVAGVDAERLPVALLEDGTRARAPDHPRAGRAPRRRRARPRRTTTTS